MLPNYNTFTSGTESFLVPDDSVQTRFTKRERGGFDISDASQGNENFLWTSQYDSATGSISLLKQGSTTPFVVVSGEMSVVDLDFSFDQNMRPAVAWQLPGNLVKFRRFDTVTGGYLTSEYTNSKTPRLTLDLKIEVSHRVNISDVLLFLLDSVTGDITVRTQRESFNIARVIYTTLPTKRLGRCGLASNNRMQIELL